MKIAITPYIAVATLTALLLLGHVPAEAQQQTKVQRVGMLVSGSVSTHGTRIEAFRQGLRELGYVEGKNIAIDYLYAEGKSNRFPELAAEMVRRNPNVIVMGSSTFARAAKKATSTIPIVATGGDLVEDGLVSSLAEPGGNVTGSTNMSPDVSGKRLELLKEAIPKASHVAVIWNPGSHDADEVKHTETAGRG